MAYSRFYHARTIAPELMPLVEEARELQNALRPKVILQDDFNPLKTIAGIDAGYDIERNLTKAVAVLVNATTMEILYSSMALVATTFPYVPGFLSFREIPAILEALACLPEEPDMLMVDGQGVAHPRRLGIAAHLGVVTNKPSIGVAKSRLCGKYDQPDIGKDSVRLLHDKGEQIGYVLRSKEKCNPLFISAGHRISQETALKITQDCLTKYRLPEPTRLADHMSKWKM